MLVCIELKLFCKLCYVRNYDLVLEVSKYKIVIRILNVMALV